MMNINDNMVLVDVNGRENPLTAGQILGILGIGWASSIIAFVLNLVYYKAHPSAIDFGSLERFKKRIILHLCGEVCYPKKGLVVTKNFIHFVLFRKRNNQKRKREIKRF